MKVIVTGGAGFIGSAVCRRLARQPGCYVLNYDALTYAANLASLDEIAGRPNYRLVQGDICNRRQLDDVFAEFQPDMVMHLAAESHVDRSITGSAAFVQTNIVGTHAMLEAALQYWDRLIDPVRKQRFRFLHVSTDEVFGSLGEEGFFDEATAYDPRSPYSASKAASDHLARAWNHTFGLPVVVSNCSNNYGPYQFPEKLIPNMILKALSGAPLPVYGDGSNVRDWLYVDDHAAALEMVAREGRVGETYVIGGHSERKNIDVVRTILDLVDDLAPDRNTPRSMISFVEDRPGHDHRYAIDCSKIENELGWRPMADFEGGLRRTVQWYIDRRDWWAPLLTNKQVGERLGLRAAK